MLSAKAFIRNVSTSHHIAVGVSLGARPTERVLSPILANGLTAGTLLSWRAAQRTMRSGPRWRTVDARV